MDYGAEFNSDLQGLGLYDKAAMKFSYAGDGYVEVFTDAKQRPGDSQDRLGVAVGVPERVRLPVAAQPRLSTNLVAITYTTLSRTCSTAASAGIDDARRRALLATSRAGGTGRLRCSPTRRAARWCRTTSAPTSSSAT